MRSSVSSAYVNECKSKLHPHNTQKHVQYSIQLATKHKKGDKKISTRFMVVRSLPGIGRTFYIFTFILPVESIESTMLDAQS